LWLTAAALPQTKRDCAKLGLTTLEKLESATIPPGRIRCKVRVALRTDDDGEQRNRVRRFDVLGIDEPQVDPFAPTGDGTDGDGGAPTATTPAPEPTDGASVAGGGGNGSAGGTGAGSVAPGATQEPGAVEGGENGIPF